MTTFKLEDVFSIRPDQRRRRYKATPKRKSRPAAGPKRPAPEGFALAPDTPRGQPNCGVVAVATAARVSYAEAVAAFGERNGNWKGRTHNYEREVALDKLGCEVSRITPEGKGEYAPWGCTAKNLAERHLLPGRRYMVTITGHSMVMNGDGWVIDQHGVQHISTCPMRMQNKRVVAVHLIHD